MDGDSLSELLCQENEASLEGEEDDVDEHTVIDLWMSYGSDLVTEEGYVEMMIKKEMSIFNFNKNQSMGLGNWIKSARLEAITWILKSRAIFGFRLPTIYLSITYLDRFLSKKTIGSEKLWAVRLLSVACLSLAAKMEEIKVPPLTEFRLEEYNFESEVIQRMELLVLNTLEWRMISITPFPFLHYFILKFCKDSSIVRQIVSTAVGFILSLMRDINLMGYRPSVIAAAATLMALDQSLTKKALECRIESISSSGILEIEEVFECYNEMQKLEMENHKTQKIVNHLDLCSPQLRSTDVLENSSVTSAINTKRKRLALNNSDQDYGLPDEKRLQ